MSEEGTLWPVRPRPLEGEILSSWLSRIARALSLSLQQFRNVSLPKFPGQGHDIDLWANPELFDVLAASSGVSVETVARTGLASEEGRLFTYLATNPDWVVPIRLGRQTGAFAFPFCPTCLATDRTPFYRKTWRYGFHPICLHHGLPLHA